MDSSFSKVRNDWFDFILFWLWCWITNVVNSSITKYFKISILPTKCIKPKYKFNQFPWWIKLSRTKSLLSFNVQSKNWWHTGCCYFLFMRNLIKSFYGKGSVRCAANRDAVSILSTTVIKCYQIRPKKSIYQNLETCYIGQISICWSLIKCMKSSVIYAIKQNTISDQMQYKKISWIDHGYWQFHMPYCIENTNFPLTTWLACMSVCARVMSAWCCIVASWTVSNCVGSVG